MHPHLQMLWTALADPFSHSSFLLLSIFPPIPVACGVMLSYDETALDLDLGLSSLRWTRASVMGPGML